MYLKNVFVNNMEKESQSSKALILSHNSKIEHLIKKEIEPRFQQPGEYENFYNEVKAMVNHKLKVTITDIFWEHINLTLDEYLEYVRENYYKDQVINETPSGLERLFFIGKIAVTKKMFKLLDRWGLRIKYVNEDGNFEHKIDIEEMKSWNLIER